MKSQTYVTLQIHVMQIHVILESEVKFDETFMKMSIYENSVGPYSVHSL